MPVTSAAPDRVPPPPLAVAAALTGLAALALAVLGVLELAHLRAIRLTMGITTSVFFLGAAVALAWCAWSLWRVRRWARGPVVMAELIQLGLAWNLRASETRLLAIALALVALVVIAGLLHPATTAALEDEPED